MGLFGNTLNDMKKKEAERQKRIAEKEEAERLSNQPAGQSVDDSAVQYIKTDSKQYRAITARLQKYDNEKTDAARMVLYYLESGGKVSIDEVEKFIKD